jgi:hypothetical protein
MCSVIDLNANLKLLVLFISHIRFGTHPLAPNIFFHVDIIVVYAIVSSCVSLKQCNQ